MALKAELEREKCERLALADIAARLQGEVLEVDRDKSRLNDKIMTLRNMSKALESENQLLIQDRDNLEMESLEWKKERVGLMEKVEDLDREIEAKNSERSEFHERFRRLESEKINVLRQNVALESQVESVAARSGNYAALIEDNANLRSARESLEQRLAEATSLYESVQNEVSLRMEEMDSNKEREKAKVKERYIQLFHEKTEELHQVQTELKGLKAKNVTFERREREMQLLMSRTQKATDSQVEDLTAKCQSLEDKLRSTQIEYEKLQQSYTKSVDVLGARLFQISDLLKSYQENDRNSEDDESIAIDVENAKCEKVERNEKVEERKSSKTNRRNKRGARKKRKNYATAN